MIHNPTQSIVCSAANGAFLQMKKYHESLLPASIWGERVSGTLCHMSKLYFRQIIYAFVLMSSNLHRLSPSKHKAFC